MIYKFLVSGLFALLLCACTTTQEHTQNSYNADVIIYGGTSAAIIAAVEVAQSGKTVIVVSPDLHLGGLSSGDPGWTDTGKKHHWGFVKRLLPSNLAALQR